MGVPQAWAQFPNLKRLPDEISARPAAAGVERLRSLHTFKTKNDDEARHHMFGHLAREGKTPAKGRSRS